MTDILALLSQSENEQLNPEEEQKLFQELSTAYLRDETAATNPEVHRILTKIQQKLQSEKP